MSNLETAMAEELEGKGLDTATDVDAGAIQQVSQQVREGAGFSCSIELTGKPLALDINDNTSIESIFDFIKLVYKSILPLLSSQDMKKNLLTKVSNLRNQIIGAVKSSGLDKPKLESSETLKTKEYVTYEGKFDVGQETLIEDIEEMFKLISLNINGINPEGFTEANIARTTKERGRQKVIAEEKRAKIKPKK